MRQKLSLKLSKNPSKKFKIYLIIILASLTLFLIAVFLNIYFQISDIRIVGNLPKDQVIGLENLERNNLLFISNAYVEKIILTNNPQISKVIIEKKFPKTIILNIVTDTPAAYLKLNKGFAILSSSGKIIFKSSSNSPTLPLINYYQKFDFQEVSVGSVIDFRDITTALFLLSKANEVNLKIDSIDIKGTSMIVFNLMDKKIILSSEKDKNIQAYEMETIIKEFEIEAKNFKTLDLRFDKPIVSF